ncbi:hypothetical protein ABIF93_010647 [Bradyrhizobium japonicum]|nr:hypothetical protein [Bradyrhizobium liaoningense]
MNVVLDCHNDRPAIAFADFKKNARPDCGGHASALQVIEPAKKRERRAGHRAQRKRSASTR